MARIPGLLPMVWPPYFPHAYHRQLGPENRPPMPGRESIRVDGGRSHHGKVRQVGISNMSPERIEAWLKTAADQLPDLLMAPGLNLTAEEVAHQDEASAKVG